MIEGNIIKEKANTYKAKESILIRQYSKTRSQAITTIREYIRAYLLSSLESKSNYRTEYIDAYLRY